MKTTITLLLTLALALFVQAAPIETRDSKGPGSPPTGRGDIHGISEPEKPQDSGWGKREDVGWNAEPAKPQDDQWGKRDLGWDSEPVKPQDDQWGKRSDIGWSSEPAKPQDSGWGP
ncbi:hypothetical protein BGZ88_002399 [Linnemannia elongata]|nr:hypothetical protein BGZ88_002399 [Linnemannia elongata]